MRLVNIEHFLQTTSRAVRNSERDGKPVKVLEVSRSFATDKATLWGMLTTPEKLAKCFLPVSGDLKVGGRFQFEGNAGGEILACEPYDKISVTWEMQGQPSWVDLTFESVEGGTSMKLQHIAEVPDEFWVQFGPGAVGIGWELGLAGLTKYIETDGAFTSADGMGWVMSDEGKQVIAGSNDGWVVASIASGTPEQEAKTAGETVYGFYTGTP